jgi:hypothetical protein
MNGSDKPPNSTPITPERALEILNRGEIDSELGMMRWSSNYTFLVSVKLDDTGVMAVYKPRSGERPLGDFPDGTLCQREVAAFITSHELGWRTGADSAADGRAASGQCSSSSTMT